VTPVPRTLPVTLPVPPELVDHTIQGKAIVPAALLLDLVVRVATEQNVGAEATALLILRDAVFPRFLPADEAPRCHFEIAFDDAPAESTKVGTRAILTSRITLAGGIRRTRTHAAVTLGGSFSPLPLPPPVMGCELELPADRAYTELILFGPRYRNLRGAVRLAPDGGNGCVCSPKPMGPEPSRAGCPYLFDSAMHLACLWGQRYAGVVAYPTGFSGRAIAVPLAHGERRCVVVPRSVAPSNLVFDLWLTDERDRVCDTIVGLAMVPLAGGPRPPNWIVHPQVPHPTP
jgi:hypothetical protein